MLNNAINFQIQGLAASIVNMAAIKIVGQLAFGGLKTKIVGQVHDELIFNVPKSEVEQVSIIVQDCMQNIMQLTVPLRTVPQFGQNYKECK
jgi:DNA polymerase-1